eukprot:6192292-Pleurochrysis_carterae.AAC.3
MHTPRSLDARVFQCTSGGAAESAKHECQACVVRSLSVKSEGSAAQAVLCDFDQDSMGRSE